MLGAWRQWQVQIAAFDKAVRDIVKVSPTCKLLITVPGISALTGLAYPASVHLMQPLVAAVGDARSFGRGRDLAAWLGLGPREATTGGKPRLLGIIKRGSRYLCKNLIQSYPT